MQNKNKKSFSTVSVRFILLIVMCLVPKDLFPDTPPALPHFLRVHTLMLCERGDLQQ